MVQKIETRENNEPIFYVAGKNGVRLIEKTSHGSMGPEYFFKVHFNNGEILSIFNNALYRVWEKQTEAEKKLEF
jgi:hypothetical protein